MINNVTTTFKLPPPLGTTGSTTITATTMATTPTAAAAATTETGAQDVDASWSPGFAFLFSLFFYLQIDYAYGMGTGTTTTPGAHEVQQQQRNSQVRTKVAMPTRVCFFSCSTNDYLPIDYVYGTEIGPRRHENSSQAGPQRPEREIKDQWWDPLGYVFFLSFFLY